MLAIHSYTCLLWLLFDQFLAQTFYSQVVLLKDFDVFDDAQLKRAVSRSNVVINLLGMDKETMNFKFEDVHIEAARKVATAAANNGLLERYLHVSCLAASPDHTSRKMRTKVCYAPDIYRGRGLAKRI